MSPPMIAWTRPRLERFKKAYAEALKAGDDTFTFDGLLYHVRFAKHLIDYLEGELQ